MKGTILGCDHKYPQKSLIPVLRWPIEEVYFKCLLCGDKARFKGTLDKTTGELKSRGLRRHIKTKMTRNKTECLDYYESLNTNNHDLDLRSSLEDRYRHLLEGHAATDPDSTSGNKRMRVDKEAESISSMEDAFNNMGESDSHHSEGLGQFADVVLPKSNSLKANSWFRQDHVNFKASSSGF